MPDGRALTQARRFEVEVLSPIDVKSLRIDGPFKHLQIGEDSQGAAGPVAREISCKALVLTMGLAWQRLPALRLTAVGRGLPDRRRISPGRGESGAGRDPVEPRGGPGAGLESRGGGARDPR